MGVMKIGQLSKIAGLGIETIRYYEKEGLIEPANRKMGSGYREYGSPAIKRLSFIKRAKDLGFSLKEIKELLLLQAQTKGKCKSIKKKAELKLMGVEAKIKDLELIRGSLSRLISACHAEQLTGECPILESLEEEIEYESI